MKVLAVPCQAEYFEPSVSCAARNGVLPFRHPVTQLIEVGRGDDLCAVGFDIVGFDPAGREPGKLECEGAVDHHEENVVKRGEVGEFSQQRLGSIEQEIRNDGYQ